MHTAFSQRNVSVPRIFPSRLLSHKHTNTRTNQRHQFWPAANYANAIPCNIKHWHEIETQFSPNYAIKIKWDSVSGNHGFPITTGNVISCSRDKFSAFEIYEYVSNRKYRRSICYSVGHDGKHLGSRGNKEEKNVNEKCHRCGWKENPRAHVRTSYFKARRPRNNLNMVKGMKWNTH